MAVEANRTVRINFIAEDQNVGTVLKSVDGKLRDVRGRFIAAGSEAKLFGETAKRAGAQAATGFARVKAEARAAQANLRGAAKSARSFITSMKDVGLVGLGLSTIVDLGRQAVQMLDELATEALEVEQVSRNLAFGIDAAAESTGGLVDNMTLARNANKAFALGVAQDSAEFAALVGSATKIAQVQGVSAQKLVEQAVVGIGRKSAARLDDLGILLDQNKAERIYAKSLGKTRSALTVLEKEEAFQKAALIEIAKAGDRAAASVDGFALTVAKGKIELQNAKQEFLGFDDSLGKVREAMRALTDEELERLRFGEVADEASTAGRELNAVLEQWGITLVDVRGAADELGVSFLDLIKGQKELREVQAVETTLKGLEALNQEQISGLKEQASEVEFLAKLGEAEGASQELTNLRMLEGLELRRDAAELQFAQTQSAADEAKVLALSRDIQLARAQTATRGGGGRGASQAQRLLAAGEQRLTQMGQMASLAALIAEDSQQIADAAEFENAAALARLDLERQALEVTRARGRFAQQELANEIEANAQASALLRVEARVAAREREKEELAELISIETARSANDAAAAAARLQFLGREFEAREVLRQQRELELVNNSPESQLGIIQQKGALQQLEFERELDRQRRSTDAAQARAQLEEKLHAEELRRVEERKRKQKAGLDATASFMRTGQQFASTIIAATIKDEDKRAKAELKARGVAALGIGALETVKSVAAFADLNFVQGALHAAAAGLAFAQGGSLLAGNIPTASGGGASSAASSPAADRETSEAARTVESLPAADQEPRRQPTAQQQGGGRVINIENLTAMGSIDPAFAENLAIELNNVNNALETGS